jgi:hypothetical protein
MGDHSFAHLETTILVLHPQGKWVRRVQRGPAIVAEMGRRPKFSRNPEEHEDRGSRISLLQVYSSWRTAPMPREFADDLLGALRI